MIQTLTKLQVADNSGAKIVNCIKIFGGSKRRYASVGDIIKVSVVKAVPKSKAKKGSMYKAVVVRTAYPLVRKDGSHLRFSDNSVVLLQENLQIVGTRVFGIIPNELRRDKRFTKLLSLAPEVI